MLMISNQIKWLRIWCPLWCFWSTGQKLNNADVGVDVLRESRVDHGESPWIQIMFRSEDTFNVQVNGDFLSLSVRISIHQSLVNFGRFLGIFLEFNTWNVDDVCLVVRNSWRVWVNFTYSPIFICWIIKGWIVLMTSRCFQMRLALCFFFKDFEVPMTWNI